MNLNLEVQKKNTYDAIVVGSGISGGWAAKELTEKGLKTLVLERGRAVEHVIDYPTALKDPWDLEHRGRHTLETWKDSPIQSKNYNTHEGSKHFFVNDKENPYNQVKPYDWVRGYHVGGRSLMWGKQTYRWSDLDFEANAKDGYGVDWPIRYADLAPWYSYVEKFAGISGSKENIPVLPDSEFLPPMDLNIVEKSIAKRMEAHWKGARRMIIGRVAHLTVEHMGRGKCQYRNMCERGCPFGGYFSSNSATLPAAQKTKKLTMRPFSIVHSIIFDEKKNKAVGVRIIDSETKEMHEYFAKIIFLCASTLGSTAVLLNSKSARFTNGLDESGQLGHNLMDHHYGVGATASSDEFSDFYTQGRRPNGIYVPRYRNIDANTKRDYVRGYGYQGSATRNVSFPQEGFGAAFKAQCTEPGDWTFWLGAWGEQLPDFNNKVSLNEQKKDKWGLPTLDIDAQFGANEEKMRADMAADAVEILTIGGMKNVQSFNNRPNPGFCIHEMGTARMGRDPKTSVLNGFNQVHVAKNVFVTDGSSMASNGVVNPSLTYMALTARACDYAVKALKKREL